MPFFWAGFFNRFFLFIDMMRTKTISRYLMATLYIVAGINHFWHQQTYLRIMPPYFPAPELLNHIAGTAEIVLGIMLFFKRTQKIAAWAIALMLVLFFTVHGHMLQQAYRNDNYLISIRAAWLRLALQPVLILWALWYRKWMECT